MDCLARIIISVCFSKSVYTSREVWGSHAGTEPFLILQDHREPAGRLACLLSCDWLPSGTRHASATPQARTHLHEKPAI